MEFIGRIYCVFESLFGQQLGEYLWGYNCETDYYVINSARFHRWWSWLIMMCFNGVLCFFFAYWWIKEDFKDNLIGDCLLYLRNDSGDIADYYITDSSFWGFSLTNAILSIAVFFLLSMLLKWGSVNCRKSPF